MSEQSREDQDAPNWVEREVGHSRHVIANAKVVVTFSAAIAATFVATSMQAQNQRWWNEVLTLGFTGSGGPGATVDLLIHLPVVVALVNTADPLDPDPALTSLDVLAWHAGEQLTTPVNNDPEYLRALFNTESTWAAAQTSEAFE